MSNQSVVHCSCYSAEEIQVGLPEGSAEAVRRVPSRARTGGGERHSSQCYVECYCGRNTDHCLLVIYLIFVSK